MLSFPEPTALQISDDPIRCAFDRRVALMPWRNRRPVSEADIAPLWAKLQHSEPSPGPRLTYVHIPFCANHCLFCGFYRNRYRPAESPRYVDLLIEEIQREAEQPMVGRTPIQALYLGGGTPTALETPDLVRLIATLRECLPLATDCELTLEGRILHCDDTKIDACLEAGVNRISIGVQSFDTQVRRRQGRRADHRQARTFVAGLIARHRAAVVIDLIYGLPGQNAEIWANDLETALELQPDGIDAYALALFPGTPLQRAISAERMPPPASLQDQGGYYEQAVLHFERAGWRQLSNSHWAATPRERNRYNRLIKQGAPTLAYGSGAGGSLGGYSYANTAILEDYAAAVKAGRKPVTGMQQADALQALRDRVVGSLEIGRLDLADLFAEAALAAAETERIVALVDHWVAAGLAHRRETDVDLTTAGRFWSNNLITALNATLTTLLQADTRHCVSEHRGALP